jgi:hypothetical protein
VQFLGACIGGDILCSGGRFDNLNDTALSIDRAEIDGNVFLRRGFHATGEVRIVGARIGGALECRGGKFENPQAVALNCQSATVTRGLSWCEVALINGVLDLTAFKVSSLIDDGESWAKASCGVKLDGFHYERFAGTASNDSSMRIAWLKRQYPDHLTENFRPQPWEQCAKVLREMGHLDDARTILIEKENLARAAGRHGAPWSLRRPWDVQRAMHRFYGWSIGYGYRPGPLVRATLVVYLISCILFWLAASPSLQPGVGARLIQPTLAAANQPICADGERCAPAAPGYDTFFAPAHALEVMMPITNLRRPPEWKLRLQDEQGSWLPGSRFMLGWTWFLTLYGWVAGVLLILWLGKLIKKD